MMSTYTRYIVDCFGNSKLIPCRRGPGQQYLKQTLTDVLKYLTEHKDMCMEINPTKVVTII